MYNEEHDLRTTPYSLAHYNVVYALYARRKLAGYKLAAAICTFFSFRAEVALSRMFEKVAVAYQTKLLRYCYSKIEVRYLQEKIILHEDLSVAKCSFQPN